MKLVIVRILILVNLVPISFIDASARNLIKNHGFEQGWTSGSGGEVHDSKFLKKGLSGDTPALGIAAGKDRQGRWLTRIPTCEVGNKYRFEAEFFRENRLDPWAYPKISLWGKNFTLKTHWTAGKYQTLWVKFECPKMLDKASNSFAFINNHPGTTFWMRNPKLYKVDERQRDSITMPEEDFFPIGGYGAHAQNLSEIKDIGLNTVVIGLNEENVIACLSEEIHCTLAVPRDPHKLEEALEKLETLIRQGRFGFYVNDEPGIHSYPKEKAEKIMNILKDRFPSNFTNMAIVRPQVIPEYQHAADYFMLDQYPVPNMPMIWLSDSMDEAADYVGRGRLQSVIQAFGGEKHAHSGWPRLPTFEEMNHLAFLSVIHGSRGIYFFSYLEIATTEENLENFKKVVGRLNSLRSWLLVHNDPEDVSVEMISEYKYDPKGKPAVHCIRKEQHNTQMLICANVLRTYVEAEVDVELFRSAHWEDYFTGEVDYVVDNTLFGVFKPLEVKVWMEQK